MEALVTMTECKMGIARTKQAGLKMKPTIPLSKLNIKVVACPDSSIY